MLKHKIEKDQEMENTRKKGFCKDKGTLEPINTIRASVLKKIC